MAEGKPRRKKPPAAPTVQQVQAEEAERSLGRAVAIGLPVVCLVAAIVVGMVASLGSALLVVASGTLLGTIALLWASVRTLSGDAPLPTDLEALAARRHGVDQLEEEKRRVLRALKDLESEHAIGKIDDEDYEGFVARYRADAKELMRKIDLSVAPLRDEAERIAREYLEKRNLASSPATEPALDVVDGRAACPSCATSNETDAAFCKKCGTSMKTSAAAGSGDAAR